MNPIPAIAMIAFTAALVFGQASVPVADTQVTDSKVGAPDSTKQHLNVSKELKDLQYDISKFIDSMPKRFDKQRKQGFGGGIGFTPCVSAIDITPIKDLLNKEPSMARLNFKLENRFSYMAGAGGMVYGGIGSGLRIGVGGWDVSQDYISDPYGAASDSVGKIYVSALYGGFLIEKAFVRGNWNLVAGGVLGGGMLGLRRAFYLKNEPSAFDRVDSIADQGDKEEATASFFLAELHVGFTYTVVTWLHVGLDLNSELFKSIGKFSSSTASFATGNGGARLRIIIGNIG